MTPYEEALARIRHAKETKAEILDLGGLPLEELPAELEGLRNLTSLDLSVCHALTDLEALRNLTSLTSLDLSMCHALTDLEVLRNLTSLTSLYLSGCAGLTDLEVLRNLTSLTSLYLPVYDALVDLEVLRNLPSLTSLSLGGCAGLANLEVLRNLTSLTSLNLSMCHALTDLEVLRNLTSLTSLDLSMCDALVDLEVLRNLTSLTSLYMLWCDALADLEVLRNLTSLTSLNLSGCGNLGSFDPIRSLLPTLQELKLNRSSFENLPVEICGDPEENVIDKVRAHFADLEQDPREDAEVKVFVLGNGGVGKSHLCNRLMPRDRQVDPATIESTHGIQVREFPLDLESSEQPARVNLWDFGGQDIYHGSHALFLQQRAVFLLLWTADRETGACDEGDLRIRHRPLTYWVDYVRNVAGTQAPLLIVQSQCDRPGSPAPLPIEEPADFDFLRQHNVSTVGKSVGLTELRGKLAGAVEHLTANLPKIGGGRVEVRQHLRQMAATEKILTVERFAELCRENGKISSPEALLSYFHECGVVFHHRDMFNGRIVLDQNWALEAIYTLLHRGKTLPVLNRHGRFTREKLRELIWQDRTDAECDTLLGMMLSCGICFRVGESEFVAPELLPEYTEALDPMLASLRDNPDHLGFVIEYPFLHDGILRDVLSRLGSQAGDNAIYWKYGCWFYEADTDCNVLVESAQEDPGGTLTVRAWGRAPREALRRVRGRVAGHRLAIPPTVRFVNFDGFDPRREEPERSPLVVAPPPDVRRQVYLSYAWGEDTTEIGRLREAAARRVIERLTAAGYHVTWDRMAMRQGDLISDFIRRIGRAENIVAILSRKYLESEYCVKELYLAYCSRQQVAEEFQRGVHPVVLPDAGLRNPAALRSYLDHWRTQRESNNELYGSNSAGRVMEDHQIIHWIAVMTNLCGLLADKVSTPIDDANLDAMVERVLEMLGEG